MSLLGNFDRIFTLHVIIIPGVGQILKLFFGTPRVNQNWDWAILTHGNCRCDYYERNMCWSKIEKCKQFFPAAGFGAPIGFHPLGQPSRQDESTPWGRFLNFTLRVQLWDAEYILWGIEGHRVQWRREIIWQNIGHIFQANQTHVDKQTMVGYWSRGSESINCLEE